MIRIKNQTLFIIGMVLLALPVISYGFIQTESVVSRVVFRHCTIGNSNEGYACLDGQSCFPKPTISIDLGFGLVPYIYKTVVLPSAISNSQLVNFKTYQGYNIYRINYSSVFIKYKNISISEFVQGGDCSTDPIPYYGDRETYLGQVSLDGDDRIIVPPPAITPPEKKSFFENVVYKIGNFEITSLMLIVIGGVLMLISII